MKKGGQLELLALLNSVLGLSRKEAEQRKLSWPSVAHMKPLRNCLLLGSTYYLYRGWSYSVLAVEVSCRGVMSFLSNTGPSKKTQRLTIVSL